MAIKDFAELVAHLGRRPKSTAVVAGAHDAHALEAAVAAHGQGQIDYLLVGRREAIMETAARAGLAVDAGRVIEAATDEETARAAVRAVMAEPGRFLMKGGLMTATLMKAAVDKTSGLRGESVLSHVALLESPAYPKLLAITDGGMIPRPNFEQKKAIAQNALDFFLAMGYQRPKVAFLAAVEVENPRMPETSEALKLAAFLNEKGQCDAAGPLSMDLAVSLESAAIKKAAGPVVGQADIIVTPDIVSGNALAKGLIYLGGATMAGCVLGAKRPIVLTSRGATAKEKYLSLALAAAACR